MRGEAAKEIRQDHPLSGAHAKLERAYEQIRDLEVEVATFLKDGVEGLLTHKEAATFHEAAKRHAERPVPMRFSILSGEIVHHLRSCFDHIAWQLATPDRREAAPHSIEFPVCLTKPNDTASIRRFERKVDGFSPRSREIIEALQPYHRDPRFLLTGPINDPLWLIHDMDRIDKHRELVLTLPGFEIRATGLAGQWALLYRHSDVAEEEIAGLSKTLDPQSEITPQVAFRDFGGRKIQPVIAGLMELSNYTADALAVFRSECF